MNNYLIDHKEFCSRAMDRNVHRPYNWQSFSNMVRYLKSKNMGTRLVTSESPMAAIQDFYGGKIEEDIPEGRRLDYMTMLWKEGKRQSSKPDNNSIIFLGHAEKYKDAL